MAGLDPAIHNEAPRATYFMDPGSSPVMTTKGNPMNTADEDPVIEKAKKHFAGGSWKAVEFRNMVRAMRPNVRGELMDIVWGEMNGTNGLGESTGFVPCVYIVEMEKGYVASPGDHPDEKMARTIYNNMCGGNLPGY
jgi:hypothetical protein